jgi:hypothetical protein
MDDESISGHFDSSQSYFPSIIFVTASELQGGEFRIAVVEHHYDLSMTTLRVREAAPVEHRVRLAVFGSYRN